MEVRGLYESINVILIKIPFGKGKNDHFRAKNWFYFILIFYKFLKFLKFQEKKFIFKSLLK